MNEKENIKQYLESLKDRKYNAGISHIHGAGITSFQSKGMKDKARLEELSHKLAIFTTKSVGECEAEIRNLLMEGHNLDSAYDELLREYLKGQSPLADSEGE